MKAPVGRGQKILYLDYDGVLHPEDVYRHPKRGIYLGKYYVGHELFENCHHLVDALMPYPDVVIVLSTTWVRVLGYSRARSHLPPDLYRRVVGATFHSAMPRDVFEQQTRPDQVLSDIRRRQPLAWLAIDDVVEGWPVESQTHFVPTHPVKGCADPTVQLMLALKLAKNFGDGLLGQSPA